MEIRLPSLSICGVLAAVVLGTGCAPSKAEQQRAADARQAEMRFELGPLVDAEGNRRSLALDSPEMNELQSFQPWLDDRTAWYHDRLDRKPGVNAGTRRTIISISETNVRDRFSSSNGRVQDNYNQSTSRDKIIEITR
ncbi:hypothetical protein [Algisphaera agarilytica]|uniref:Lipoprotein n=1 Tax=Algisphaera agarilytica TaxID=1385975 RepID=A0A7X0HBI5_9BACT|nr:hypothetical protein [Algisphaera agarilytica]MBB6431676.1 hypothetical protein [Algisphaera agarilytica]